MIISASGAGVGAEPAENDLRAAPDYVSGMTLNRWYALSGGAPDLGLSATNDVSDVMGSLSPFSSSASDLDTPWNIWAGFAYANLYGDSGAIAANGGGHQGTDWPGFYFWDLATRNWAKDADSAPGSTTITDGLYSNGAPGATHTSYNPHCRTLTGELVLCISETDPGDPASKRVAFRKYDPATDLWSGGAVHGSGGGHSLGGCAVYDPELDRTVFLWGPDRWTYDWATDTETSFSYPLANDNLCGTFLPANGVRAASYLMAIREPNSSPEPFLFVNTASPTSDSTVQATPSGIHAQHNTGGVSCFFSPGEDAFFVAGATPSGLASIYRYDAPATIPGSWTGADINPTIESALDDWLDESEATSAANVYRKLVHVQFAGGEEVIYVSGWPTYPVMGLRIR